MGVGAAVGVLLGVPLGTGVWVLLATAVLVLECAGDGVDEGLAVVDGVAVAEACVVGRVDGVGEDARATRVGPGVALPPGANSGVPGGVAEAGWGSRLPWLVAAEPCVPAEA
jgi:hypothetical protein